MAELNRKGDKSRILMHKEKTEYELSIPRKHTQFSIGI